MPGLVLKLLDGLSLSLGDKPVAKLPGKALALFCYLVVTNRPHRRDELLTLLWDSSSGEDYSANLRVTLTKLRKDLGCYLEIGRHEVSFQGQVQYYCDVAKFISLLRDRHNFEAQSEALELYQTDFMAGFYVPDAPVFEEWQQHERERLRALASQGLQQLLSEHLKVGNHHQALACAQRLLALEPWHEETYRLLMVLFAQQGDYSAALVQFERCKALLAKELGIIPSRETMALGERIDKARQRPQHNLPAQTQGFVGRETEMLMLIEALQEERLVTILAPGGMGKTRLAIEAGLEQASRFLEGVVWVPLEDVSSREELFNQLATALGLASHQHLEELLINELREKSCLLIFDNAEHLISDLASLLQALLDQTLELKVLVTSRERLNLTLERTLVLKGLSFPEAENWHEHSHSGITLFLQQAERFGYSMAGINQQAVAEIVARVSGMPLAIELAASWTRVMSVTEIAEELEHDYNVLVSNERGRPQRHSSIEQVFEQSWQLLNQTEQASLAALSVFKAGFSREAAQQVCGVVLNTLRQLLDKSLIAFFDQRYTRHPLMQQYYQQKLQTWPEAQLRALRQRYNDYYLAQVMKPSERLWRASAEEQQGYFATLSIELLNIHQAFVWASDDQLELVQRAIKPLGLYHNQTGQTELGQRLVQTLLAGLGSKHPALCAHLMVQDAFAYYIRGLSDRAIVRAEEVVSLADQSTAVHSEDRVVALNTLGLCTTYTHGYHQAKPYFTEALQLIESSSSNLKALVLSNLGNLQSDFGHYEEGLALLEESLRLAQEENDTELTIKILNNIAGPLIALDQDSKAQRYLTEGLRLARSYQQVRSIPYFYNNLGDIALKMADYEQAKVLFHQGIETAKPIHEYGLEASLYALKGRAYCLSGELTTAQALYLQGFELSRDLNIQMLIPSMSIFVAELQLKRQQVGSAGHILATVSHHLELVHSPELVLYHDLAQQVEDLLSEDTFENLTKHQQQVDLATLEEEMLALLSFKDVPSSKVSL